MGKSPIQFLGDLTKPTRQAVRTALVQLGRTLAPVVVAGSRRPETEKTPISLHVLLSAKSWRIGMMAILSFEHFTARRWNLFIHEDGSISEADRTQILTRLPGARWVSRSEADEAVAKMLAPFPALQRRRDQNIYTLKFFDSLAFAPGSHYVVLDGDVLFYARPEEIITWAENFAPECWFNWEEKEAYGAPREQIEEALGFPVWKNVNSGLSLVYKNAMSLEGSERFILACEARGWHQHVVEQALFAVNASVHNQGGSLPRRYEISKRIFRRPSSVCRHYVGPFKEDLLFVEGPLSLLWLMSYSLK